MKTLQLDNFKINLPSYWSELSIQQLRFLARLCIKGSSEGEIKLKMLLYCAGMRVRKPFLNEDLTTSFIVQKGRKRFNIDAAVFTEITAAFDFLFNEIDELDDNQLKYIEPSGLTHNPLPRIKVFNKVLFGPGDILYNLTMNEFSLIEVYRYEYVRNKDNDSLNKMLSILYRPKGKVDGDDRIMLTSKVANNGYWRLKYLKPEDKLVIYWFYTGVLLYLRERFIRTFSGNSSATQHNIYDEMNKMINSLAMGDMTRKNMVRDGLLWDALYSTESALETQEKSE